MIKDRKDTKRKKKEQLWWFFSNNKLRANSLKSWYKLIANIILNSYKIQNTIKKWNDKNDIFKKK
jgi:hypothetical protein